MLMRKLLIVFSTFILAAVCMAQDEKDKGRLNPTPDLNAPFKVYIPKDLEDCFVELKKMLSPALINEMKASSEDRMIMYHDNLGRWIRNNWALWAGSQLSKYFNELGINHPDDMSGIILNSFWRHINSQPIKLGEQIERYKNYWRDLEEKEAGVSPVSKTAMNIPLKAYGGKSIKLRYYSGQVVVLSWWSIFCEPQAECDEALPHLVRIKNDFATNGVEVIGLTGIYPPNQTEFNRLVRKAIKRYKINFPIVCDDERFTYDVEEYEKFGYASLPQVFVISRDSRVIKRIRGFDVTALREAVEKAVRDIPKNKD
jgi:peroxiredoxin